MTSSTDDAGPLHAYIARLDIDQLMRRYCRGMDRADQALLEGVFAPDAVVVTGAVDGSGAAFPAEIVRYLRANVERCWHFVNTGWIEVERGCARGEFYVFATMEAHGVFTAGGGRYTDEFELRGREWRITRHIFISDWSFTQPATAIPLAARAASTIGRGAFAPDDPVYAHWLREHAGARPRE